MSASPNLRLPYLDANQNQKTVTHNAALRMLDALVNLHVASMVLQAPPAAPNDGQCWIVASHGSGAWLGKDLNIAAWQDGAWTFYAPNPGFVAYVDALQGAVMWNGAAWVSLLGAISQLSLAGLGIGTAVDAGNPLSAKLNAALFAAVPTTASPAGTGDLRVKLSKQTGANTASLLFQDNYAGRAEIGLIGDDNFHFKVSPDGTSFTDALVVAGASGAVSFAATPTHPSPAVQDNSTASATTAWVLGRGYTTAAAAASAAPVQSVAGRVGAVTLAVGDVSGAAPLVSPALSGTPTAPNAAAGTNTAQIATTSFVAASFVTYAYAGANYATANNATLSGTPTAPTQAAKDNSTRLATTAYADRAVSATLTRTQVNDAAYAMLPTDRTVAVIALTAPRTLTLPAASAYPSGATLTLVDESGACSAASALTVLAAGSDTVNGAASATINVAYGYVALQSNTANKWTVVDAPAPPLAFDAGAALLDPLSLALVLPSFDYRLLAPDVLPPGQFSRLTTGYRTLSSGLLQAIATGTPRIDHDPVTGANLGLLIEESRTNLLLYSGDTAAGGWAQGSSSSFQGLVTAPDGTNTARVVRMSSNNNAFIAQGANLAASTVYTLSGWFKLIAGTPSAGGLLLVTNGSGALNTQVGYAALTGVWQRFSTTFTAPSAGSVSAYGVHDMGASGNVDVAAWGLQIEAGPFPSSYIPTTSAQVTRAADTLIAPLTSDWFNGAEGTVFVEAVCPPLVAGRYPGFFALDDGTINNALECFMATPNNLPLVECDNSALSSGNSASIYASSGLSANTLSRLAVSYTATTVTVSVNGGAVASFAQTFPSGLNTLRIGQTRGGGNVPNTQIRRLAYIPRAMSAALLQRISA